MRHRLSVRVLLGSVVLLVALFGVYAFFTVRYFEDEMTKSVLGSANRTSDVIKKSTHYSMLLNRKEDVYQIITTIGTEPGVEGIRIYNKRGEITFSTDSLETGTVVDLHEEACTVCHDGNQPLTTLPMTNRVRIYQSSSNGHRILGLIDPIRNEPSCSGGSCHAHPQERQILGVLDVRMSLAAIDAQVAQTKATIIMYAVIMIFIAAIIAVVYFLSIVIAPIRRLMAGVREVGAGNLSGHITVGSRDEFGTLAAAFNDMTASLRREKDENRKWAETLEERIAEKTDELKRIHGQILQIEKMASLGKLAATVAHEINNPLEAILTYAKLIARRLSRGPTTDTGRERIVEDVNLIARETDRCGMIVKNLLLFSKKQVGEFALTPLTTIIDKASQIVDHHLSMSNVKMDVRIPDKSITLMCDENQIEQALVALFVNAVEAMPDGGTVRVAANSTDDTCTLTIADSGVGILPEDLPNIFEPFYTTKKDGKGVGLGLSVVYGIVERHNGTIGVASEPGKGTTFTLTLPRITAAPRTAYTGEYQNSESSI